MTVKLVAAAAALLLVVSGCMTRGGDTQRSSGAASASGASGSSQQYPTGSTATPSGVSPGQGAGQSGSATTDTPSDQRKR